MIWSLAFAKTAVFAAPAVAVVAQATSASGISPLSIINTTAQVAFLILFVHGDIVPRKQADEQRKRAETAEAQLAALNEQLTDKVIPALTLATHALDQIAPFLQAEIAIRTAQNSPPRGP